MSARRLLVIGASGDIGQGIVRAARTEGMLVVAAGRTLGALSRFSDDTGIALVSGDLSSEDTALALWEAAQGPFGSVDAVVVAVNAPNLAKPLLEWSAEDLTNVFAANLLTHFNAVKVMLPRLPYDGLLIGIGGGTADFVLPGMGQLSMMQAAQRMMYRSFARERRTGAELRELMLISMINGESKRDAAEPHWVTDNEVGQHVCAILADPATFKGPILRLKSREQVGLPEAREVRP